MLFLIAMALLVVGGVLIAVGGLLNIRTPIQQALPVIGVVLGVLGLGMIFLFYIGSV